jgi:hypothetical protein
MFLMRSLTIVAQEIYKTEVGVANAHEEHLCRIVRPDMISTEAYSGLGGLLDIVVPDVRCQLPSLESARRRVI